MIYLDNAATTQPDPSVVQAMMPYLQEQYGNPGSIHAAGQAAASAVSKARQQVANMFDCVADHIIFTSGGSEANNLVLLGLRDYLRKIGKKRVIVSAVEHESVLKAAECIKREFDVEFLGVKTDGAADLRELTRMLKDDDVGLVSIMYVNNETGAINDIASIASICHEHGALFHSDCVQAAPSLRLGDYCFDFASISSHKIHGPKGVGALYVEDKSLLTPIIRGGADQEYGLRGGTENVPGIVGFGKACEIALINIRWPTTNYSGAFYNRLVEQLELLSEDKESIHINGPLSEQRVKNILNIMIDDVDAETLILALSAKGVCISAGSACNSHESVPSHVLTAMGVAPDGARSSVRISFSSCTTTCEMNEAAVIMARTIHNLRGYH